jgi:hypothetical protein
MGDVQAGANYARLAKAPSARTGAATKAGPTVDTVLGVSITSTGVGWVLVDGSAADGATLDHDAFDVDVSDTSQHAVAVRGAQAIAAATGHQIRSIGVTWTDDVQAEARQLLASLREAGYDNLVEMRLPQAAKAWAQGIGRDLGYEKTAVCVVEPAAVTVLNIDAVAGAVQIDVTHSRDSANADGLGHWLADVFAGDRRKPDSLLLIGSRSDRDQLAESLDESLPMPVIGTAEAQLVLARGAALALLNDADVADVEADDQADDASKADVEAPPVDNKPPRMGSWLASHAQLSTIATAGLVVVVIALVVVVPRLLAEKQPSPTESPTGTTTPPLATAQAVPPPAPPPPAPPQMIAAEPPQAPIPTEVPETLAVPVPEVDFIEDEPPSTPAVEPVAVVNEPHAPLSPVAIAPGPIAAPPVEPVPAPPPNPGGSVLSPIFGALP